MENKKVLAIIPARGGSKRLPKKNIKLLDGKPLIAHTIDFAINSQVINKVILSTESEEIAAIAKKYGADVLMRPDELAQDTTKTAPVMLHVVEELEKQGYVPDIVILLQPTCPVREKYLSENVLLISMVVKMIMPITTKMTSIPIPILPRFSIKCMGSKNSSGFASTASDRIFVKNIALPSF